MNNSSISNFKFFLHSAIAFVAGFLFLLGIACCIQLSIFEKLFSGSALFLGKEKTVLFVGDSHFVHAIDPSGDSSWENIAMASEPFFCSRLKIKKYLEANPQIEKVCIPYWEHVVLEFPKDYFKRWDAARYNRYYYLFDFETRKTSFQNLEQGARCFLVYGLGVPLEWQTRTLKYLRGASPPFQGGFHAHEQRTEQPNSLEKTIGRHYYKNETVRHISTQREGAMLKEMIALTEENGVQLILISTPVEMAYDEQVPATIKQEFERRSASITNRYPQVSYIDSRAFFHSKGNEADYFYDSDHLNKIGATKFSEHVSECLKKK